MVSDPNACGGDPITVGTRIAVYVVLDHLAAGDDYDTALASFPPLTRDDILACPPYASYLTTEKALVAWC